VSRWPVAGPSEYWLLASSPASKFPRLIKNIAAFYGTKIHYHVQRHALFVPVLTQINLAHAHYPGCWRSNINIIFAYTPRFPNLSLSLKLSQHNCIWNFLLPLACLMPRPPHSSWFYHLKNLLMATDYEARHFTLSLITLLPRPSWAHISSSAPYTHVPSAHVPPSVWETKFHTHIKQQVKCCFIRKFRICAIKTGFKWDFKCYFFVSLHEISDLKLIL